MPLSSRIARVRFWNSGADADASSRTEVCQKRSVALLCECVFAHFDDPMSAGICLRYEAYPENTKIS